MGIKKWCIGARQVIGRFRNLQKSYLKTEIESILLEKRTTSD